MKNKSWTLFGAGENFIDDIFDSIEANGGKVKYIATNQKLSKKLYGRLSEKSKIVPVNEFKKKTSDYFFGFVDPNKNPFLELLKKEMITFSNLIHPFSYVSKSAILGQGNFIGAGSVIGSSVKIGNFNIINRSSSIGHHVVIGDFNHIGPGTTISGMCRIGSKNFFGSGSTLIDGRTVGNNIIIGAGSVILNDLNKPGTYVGVPAKKLKK